jgi:hypothetical protein
MRLGKQGGGILDDWPDLNGGELILIGVIVAFTLIIWVVPSFLPDPVEQAVDFFNRAILVRRGS